jgi:ABC-2 type transport system ATP-binding protein
VEEICDHIVLVNKGNKILDGAVSEIKQRFKKNIFEIEFDEALVAEHTATHLFNIESFNEKKLTIRINNDFSKNQILSYFIDKNANIASFNEMLPSLNDIFIELVQGTPETRQFQQA